ncbi:hypothetical protein BGZ70_003077 [Mortierella alpina]|uniref:Tail specific protease domain-containing protein n=1 Tax=Mortierella alpina TaxID=64518 RepID=A0A9P6JID7_MORAP|nr:hypothetical protein BGZ70_003077 [Mortierella alpina]
MRYARSWWGRTAASRIVLSLVLSCIASSYLASAAPSAPRTGRIARTHPQRRQDAAPPGQQQPPAQDPCKTLGTLTEPAITWTHVQQCYESIPYSASEANEVLSTMHMLFKEFYIFLDTATLEDQPKPFSNPPLDILKGLDLISQRDYGSDFQFQTDVDLLVTRLNDAHANYLAYCYRHYLFVQPFELYAPVVNNAQSVRILADESGNGLEDCEVLTIDGVDAMKAIQDWADTHVGFSKDAGVRLNKALTQLTFNAASKQWTFTPGLFTTRATLPERQTMVYKVKCPTLEGASEETVTADWNVFRLMSWRPFNSRESFLTHNCYRDTSEENSAPEKAKRDLDQQKRQQQRQQLSEQLPSSKQDIRRQRERHPQTSVQAAVEIPRHETIQPSPVLQKRQSVQVARMVHNGSTTAFYQLLRRPSIGVVVIPTHTVNLRTESEVLIEGFQRLYDTGVRNVILDLTSNGGGYVNFAYDLVEWMFPDANVTSVYRSNLRASMSIKALAQGELKDDDYNGYFNPGAFADPDTEEPHEDNFFLQDGKVRYAKHPLDYSPTVHMIHTLGSLEKGMPWQNDAQRIVVMTDGACGSACGMTLNRLKNRHGVQSYAVGGRMGEDLSLFSFPGASVYGMEEIINDYENLGVDSPLRRLRYKGIYRVPVMQFFQDQKDGTVDPVPIEYNPKLYKADFHLDYTPSSARNHELLWEIVANNHWKAAGQTGDDPAIEKP